MGKINLIDQLRKRGGSSSADIGGGKASVFAKGSEEVEFEESSDSGDGGGLDAYEKRKVVMLLFGIMLVLGGRQLVPLYTGGIEGEARQTESELITKIAAEKKKAEELKLVQEEMKQYEGRVEDLRSKLQKVQQLEANRNLLVRMTDYIVKEMPQRLWFDNLDLDTRAKVLISGYSSNYQIVSDFMKKLEGAVYFPKWRLVQTENQPENVSSMAPSVKLDSANAIVTPPDSKKFTLEAEAAKL
ncbi:MAG TPA: PilN domain-containing protein [Bdellovibrionota bacterium]|jgi:Tfp pilus assembly protein PilN|nr:PilN domain-containing protein [Bdellovibrionota bacterium]